MHQRSPTDGEGSWGSPPALCPTTFQWTSLGADLLLIPDAVLPRASGEITNIWLIGHLCFEPSWRTSVTNAGVHVHSNPPDPFRLPDILDFESTLLRVALVLVVSITNLYSHSLISTFLRILPYSYYRSGVIPWILCLAFLSSSPVSYWLVFSDHRITKRLETG